MNLGDLRTFLTVARTGTLTAASVELHQTPSALSKRLRRLEDALGVVLFDREGVRLRLDDAGRRLVPRARRLVDLADAVQREFDPRIAGMEVRLAAPAILQWQFAKRLADAAQVVRGVRALRLDSMHEKHAAIAVAEGAADLALVTGEALSAVSSAGLERCEAGRFHMVLAAAANAVAAPLACTVTSPLCGQVRSLQDGSWYAGAGLPEPRFRADDLTVVLRLVRQGHARAFLPDFLVEAEGLISTAGEPQDEAVWAVWRREAPSPVGKLAGHLAARDPVG